jgi:ribosomal protein L37AE/L43A
MNNGGNYMKPKPEKPKKEVLEVKHWYHQCPFCGKTIKVILKER